MARLLIVTRERYHEFRYRQDMAGSECVPVLLAALGQITGTDTGADGDSHEMIATAPTTLWSLTADRHRSGSLAQSVERLGLSARAVRDQMSNDTWMVLAAVERAVLHRGRAMPESRTAGEAFLVVGAPRDAGRDARPVRSGRRVDGAGRRLDHDGHRQAYRARSGADSTTAGDVDDGPQSWRRTDRHRIHVGGLRVVGHLPTAQPRRGEHLRGRRPGAAGRGEPAVAGLPIRAAARRPQGAARLVRLVAARAVWSTSSAPGCADSTRPTSRMSAPTACAANSPICSM